MAGNRRDITVTPRFSIVATDALTERRFAIDGEMDNIFHSVLTLEDVHGDQTRVGLDNKDLETVSEMINTYLDKLG